MVSSIKLPILKKGEYILWTMKMKRYLAHTDYALWEVILNGNGEVQMTKDEASNEVEKDLSDWDLHKWRNTNQASSPPIAPPEAPQMVSSIKLPILKKGEYILWTMKMERYLAHTDYALWEVILNGNGEVQMTKDEADEHLARFHGIKDAKTLWAAIKTRFGDKGYDRFQRLLSLLEIHEEGISNEDANQKFLRSLPSVWSNISFIMRNKPVIDNLYTDDMYNNLKVYGANIKAIVLKHKVAMLSMRVKPFYNKTGRMLKVNGKEPVGFDKTKGRDNGKRPVREEDEKALVVKDGLGTYDWSYQLEEEATDFALMSFTSNTSSSSSLNSEREKLRKANLEIVSYQYGLEPIKGQLCVHQQNEVSYKENIGVLEYDVKDKCNLLKYTQKQLDKALKEKEDLKAKLEKFETASKNLTKLLNSQISAKVKTGLGNDSQFNEKEVLDVKEEEVTETVFDNRSSDEENSLANDRFNKDRMAKKSILPNNMRKGTGHRESRPVWNNVQRINHQNKFASTAVFRRSRRILVSAAKPKAATSTSAAKPVNTAGPKQSMNFSNSRITFHKSHSPIRRSFYNATAHLRSNSTERVNTDRSKAVSAVKASAGGIWRPRVNEIDQISKDNRALVTKPHNKTPYELLNGRSPRLDFMRPFGCHVTILNTLDPLGKFEGKADEGFLVGYSVTSKAFRVFNTKTKKVKENLHVRFLENKPNVAGTGPKCLVDIDSLKNSMNYILVSAGNQTNKNSSPQDTNGNTGIQDNVDVGKEVFDQHHIMLPLWSFISSTYKSSYDKAKDDKPKDNTSLKTVVEPVNKEDQAYRDELDRLMSQEKEASDATDSLSKEFEQRCMDQRGAAKAGSTNSFKSVSNPVNAASTLGTFSASEPLSPHPDAFIPDDTLLHVDQDDSQIPDLEDTVELRSIGIFTIAYDDDLDTFTSPVQSVGAEVDFNNMESSTVKTEGNAEFHQIVEFLTSSSIHHALTVIPTIYASIIEQFWNTANSQTINYEKQIHATVDGKTVVITES
nr:retrovirus-related Pol polyprotein from transposon TNT 1-94 [Tanacetum cinerariifolium]